MSAEADAIIKAACIQAAAMTWMQTNIDRGPGGGANDPAKVADMVADYAATLLHACQKRLGRTP